MRKRKKREKEVCYCSAHLHVAGYGILHPLLFLRLVPTLITLYVLHHDESDRNYHRGLLFLREMDTDKLVHFIHFQELVEFSKLAV